MLTDAELAGMRATAAAALPDIGTITRPAAPNTGTLNPTTGVWTPTAATAVWTGNCRVRPPTSEEYEVIFGEREVTEFRYVGTFPWDLPDVEIGDRLALTTASDPRVAAASFRITRIPFGSWLVDRRLGLEVVT